MKPAIKPVDNSKKSVTSLQTPLSEDLVKVLENYRIARLSLPGKWRRNVQIKKKDLGRRSTLSNVSRGSLLLWDDGHHQKTLTWHLGGGIPICQEYGERQNTENWKEYSGYLWGADCASVWFIRGTKNSQSFHGWGHSQSATPICCPTQSPRNYLSKAKCHWTIYFSSWELQKMTVFNLFIQIKKSQNWMLTKNLFTWLNNWLKAKCRAASPCSHPLTKF